MRKLMFALVVGALCLGTGALSFAEHHEGQGQAEAGMPFGRLIKPDELASLIAFVASDEAGMMTGAVIDFDQSVIGSGPQPIPRRHETP